MIDLSRREKSIFIVTMIFASLALVYNFIVEPAVRKWDDLNRDIYVKKVVLRKWARSVNHSREIIKRYTDYTSSFKGVSSVLNSIENQAAALGVTTTNIKPGPIRRKDVYGECEIELQIEGEVRSVQSFISTLIRPPIRLTLKKFDFRSKPENPAYLKGTLVLSKLII